MNSAKQQGNALSLRTRIAYAAPAPALAFIGTVFYVFVPKFYADVIGLRLGVLSLIILVSRIWDAVIDPAAGHFSDRTITRWGRRRPWMAIGVVPLALAFSCSTAPPSSLTGVEATIWLVVSAFMLFLFWTAIVIPYEALGPELTFDYDERNRLFAWREGGLLLGTLLGAVLPTALTFLIEGEGAAAERTRFMLLGMSGALLLGATVAFSVASLRESRLAPSQRPQTGFLKASKTILKNRPFRILMIAYTISAIGSQLPATLILFYVEYVLGSKLGGLFLLLYLGTGFMFIPLWVYLGNRLEKRTVWLAALAVNTVAFAAVAILGKGDLVLYGFLIALSAVGLGGTLVIPASMEADVIDVDEAENGVRREGVFSGVWSICKKLAAALGAGVGLALLDVAGYIPNKPQSGSVVLMLRCLYAVVPCVCNGVAVLVAWHYPLTRSMHAKLRTQIQTRLATERGKA